MAYNTRITCNFDPFNTRILVYDIHAYAKKEEDGP